MERSKSKEDARGISRTAIMVESWLRRKRPGILVAIVLLLVPIILNLVSPLAARVFSALLAALLGSIIQLNHRPRLALISLVLLLGIVGYQAYEQQISETSLKSNFDLIRGDLDLAKSANLDLKHKVDTLQQGNNSLRAINDSILALSEWTRRAIEPFMDVAVARYPALDSTRALMALGGELNSRLSSVQQGVAALWPRLDYLKTKTEERFNVQKRAYEQEFRFRSSPSVTLRDAAAVLTFDHPVQVATADLDGDFVIGSATLGVTVDSLTVVVFANSLDAKNDIVVRTESASHLKIVRMLLQPSGKP